MKKHSLILALGLGVMAVAALAAPLQAATFDVNVDDPAFTLYTDPNTGNEVKLGGFSGLFPVPGHPFQLYTVSDVGPSPSYLIVDDITAEEPVELAEFKVRVRPDMGPRIIKLQLLPDNTAEVLEITPLVTEDGDLITGRPNFAPTEVYNVNLEELDPDPNALDAEGITMGPWGRFWICEEGRPSIAWVAPDGTVLARLVPQGVVIEGTTVPTFDILPGILAKRVNNKGLEGIAYAGEGKLFATMQRPLANPDKDTSEASRNIRLISVDLEAVFKGKTKNVVRQYLFVADLVHKKDYASDLFAVTPSVFLVPERKADVLYAIDVSKATEISGFEDADGKLLKRYWKKVKKFTDDAGNPPSTIEMLNERALKALKIKPVKKMVVLDSMTAIDESLSKCEGICLVGRNIVLTADNDFNLDDTVVDDDDPEVLPVPLTLQDPTNLPKIHVVPVPRDSVLKHIKRPSIKVRGHGPGR